ncbi:MAG: UDP-N-acetylglucosamine 2-epimerase (non-hydrolyzing), partial [Puniceicoccaceae bacterium]
ILDELGIPVIQTNLNVGSGSHAVQTATIMMRYEAHCLEHRPDLVIVVGDVNSTIACALTAKKLGLQVAHLESGLRSRDLGMPEEINRLLTDRISDVLWTPSRDADENLAAEGVDRKKISFVGNLMIDSLVRLKPRIDSIDIQENFGLKPHQYALLTLHRPSNVDEPERFLRIMREMERVVTELERPIVFPVHPRTRSMVERPEVREILERSHFLLFEPLSYVKFMALVQASQLLITDSGGIQEETTFLGIPCFTLRANTERPITILEGTNHLVEPENLMSTIRKSLAAGPRKAHPPQYWDGQSAARVVEDLFSRYWRTDA